MKTSLRLTSFARAHHDTPAIQTGRLGQPRPTRRGKVGRGCPSPPHMVGVMRCAPILLLLLALAACRQVRIEKREAVGGLVLENQSLLYAIGADGQNDRFVDRQTERNYATPNSPCARVKKGGKDFAVKEAIF